MSKSALMIVNPRAGKMRSKSGLFSVAECLCNSGYDVSLRITTSCGDGRQYVEEHAKEHDLLVCCGGDGTLNEVVNGMLSCGMDIPLGYIPTGTTNDFASSVKLPKNIQKAAQIAVSGKLNEIDAGKFNENKYFTYIASFGVFTQAAYQTDQKAKNLLGHAAYVIDGIYSVADIKDYHMIIKTDKDTVEGDFIFGSVSNTTSVGGILKLDERDVSMSDGKFEILLIKKPKNPFEFGNTLQSLVTHSYNTGNVLLLHASCVTFDSGCSVDWTVDGEYAGFEKTVTIENICCGLKMMLPE